MERFAVNEADIDPSRCRAKAFKRRNKTPNLVQKKTAASPVPGKDLVVATGYGYKARTIATLGETLAKLPTYAPRTGEEPNRAQKEKKERNWKRFAELALGLSGRTSMTSTQPGPICLRKRSQRRKKR